MGRMGGLELEGKIPESIQIGSVLWVIFYGFIMAFITIFCHPVGDHLTRTS